MRPDPLPLTTRLRSNLLLAPPFFLTTGLFASIALIVSLFEKDGRRQHRLARIWARISVFCSGSRLQVLGLPNIPHQAAVFAANHTSYMDTPVVFASLPFQFRILARKSLWQMPFIGWYLNRSGQIPIDTDNPRATVSSLGAGVKALRASLSIFVFPEGGRTHNREMQPFLNGASYLAIRAQVPLVPVALIGVYDLLPIHTAHFYPAPDGSPLKLIFGTPIPTTGLHLRDSEALTTQLRDAIAALLQHHH